MEIKQIKYFVAVAEELNFRKAAEKLFISQPPLSRQIKLLEEELGVILLLRNNKEVSITDAGQSFLQDAKKIISLIEQAKENASNTLKGLTGTINISCVITGMLEFLPLWIAKFKNKYPSVNIIVSETAGTQNIIDNLYNEKTDISFTYGLEPDNRILSKVVHKEKIMYAFPEGHPLLRHERISLDMIKEQNIIFFPRDLDKNWYDTFLKVCESKSFVPNIIHHAHPMQNRLNMVAMKMGITFVAESLKKSHTHAVEYRYPVEEETMYISVTASYRKDFSSIIINNFLEEFQLK